MDNGFWSRLKSFRGQLFISLDFALSLIATVLIYGLVGERILQVDTTAFISGTRSLATASLGVLLTGIVLLVSLSNAKALVVLRKEQSYEKFLFSFEFTTMLALFTAAFALFLDVVGATLMTIYALLFLILFLITALASVVANLITYGQKLATIEALQDVPKNLDIVVEDLTEEGDEELDNRSAESESE